MTFKKAKALEELLIEKIEQCAVGISGISPTAGDEHAANAIYKLVLALETLRVDEDDEE